MAKPTKKQPKKFDTRRDVNVKQQIKKVDIGIKDNVFIFTSPLSLSEVAEKLHKSTAEVVKYFFMQGKMFNANTVLSIEQIGELCLENGLDFKIEKEVDASNILDNITFDDTEEMLQKRPPIITIMGHVDHGKTTLLDAIRNTNVTAGESGGITQHIGAYQASHKNQLITFIDTPGHEAFTEMRIQGANVTDIVVLVVAADDGIKAQTQEAINHSKVAGVPIIVFVNKMDKEGANPDRVISQLNDHGIIAEEWGGETMVVKGSARQKQGMEELLEAILMLSEMHDLKCNPNRLAYGNVLEANLDKGLGPVATLLVRNGTLEKGDFIVCGSSYGKVRMMFDENMKEVKKAPPAKPVQVSGLDSVPFAGEKFLSLKDEKEAKEIARSISEKKTKKLQFDAVNSDVKRRIEAGELKSVNVILKTDVHGSLEAIKSKLNKLSIEDSTINIVHFGVGAITESDVRLAQVANAIIVGFNIKPNNLVREKAKLANVPIYFFNVIYALEEQMVSLLKGILDPIIQENILGEANVLKTFKHSEIGTICGSYVTSGLIKRGAKARVIRDGQVIYTSEIATLKHLKDQVTEVKSGKECGFTIKNFNDVKEGDVIECFQLVEKTYDEVNSGK